MQPRHGAHQAGDLRGQVRRLQHEAEAVDPQHREAELHLLRHRPGEAGDGGGEICDQEMIAGLPPGREVCAEHRHQLVHVLQVQLRPLRVLRAQEARQGQQGGDTELGALHIYC